VQNTDAASNGMFSRIISFRERERYRQKGGKTFHIGGGAY